MKGLDYSLRLLEVDDLPEAIRERIYFCINPSGGGKMHTSRGKHYHLDRKIAEELDLVNPHGDAIRVHDIGASNAITSVEFFSALSKKRSVEFWASEYNDAVFAFRVCCIDIIYDRDWGLLQIAFGSRALSMRRGPWRYLLGGLGAIDWRRNHIPKRISLFHPEALRLSEKAVSFKLRHYDMYNAPRESFDVIRALNVIWKNTDKNKLKKFYRSISKSLKEGGFLIIGDKGDFSIFLKKNGSVEEKRRIGNGFFDAESLSALIHLRQ